SSSWADAASSAVASGSTALLGFNEPELSAQANLTPSHAAALWRANMEPFAGEVKLVSPSVSGAGLHWLSEFFKKCGNCTFDAIGVHWTGSATESENFQTYLATLQKQWSLPLWVTEFSMNGTESQRKDFLQTMIPWLESQRFVHRYAMRGMPSS
ncbi:hypothetical protein T439DRAFT_289222, partial [Meredithblackwellia eburnea MCA 4105]